MIRGPQIGRSTGDHLTKASASWGNPPEWIVALAEACARSSQSAIAKQLDYSPATVSQVLSNSYRGDLGRVEEAVRGILMAETVMCPVLGEIARKACWDWQAKAYAPTSQHRVHMYHACRSNCPNSRIVGTQAQGEDA